MTAYLLVLACILGTVPVLWVTAYLTMTIFLVWDQHRSVR